MYYIKTSSRIVNDSVFLPTGLTVLEKSANRRIRPEIFAGVTREAEVPYPIKNWAIVEPTATILAKRH